MKSKDKHIGKYIRLVDERNTGIRIKRLLGLSISKVFIPSVANVIGTDMENYKIIRKNQFACSLMQVRRDKKMPVALLLDFDEAIISQAYSVFEVKNEKELLPEYLMLWFSRSEFDREACFHAVGGVRGSMEWQDFENLILPVPHINKQKEIVNEFNIIEKCIAINHEIIRKLDESIKTIFRQWFEEFDFPDHNGKPYKSNGGQMSLNEKLGSEIPKGWNAFNLQDVVSNFISKRGKSKSLMNLQLQSAEFKYPVISAMHVNKGKIVRYETMPYVNEKEYRKWMNPKLELDDVILTSEAPLGETYYVADNAEMAISQRLFALRTNKKIISGLFLYQWLNTSNIKKELEGRSSGTTVSGIKLSELKKIVVLIPEKNVERNFFEKTIEMARLAEIKSNEIQKLRELKDLLLSKLTLIDK